MKQRLDRLLNKTKKLSLHFYPDLLFNDLCVQLETKITDLFCVINQKGRVRFIPSVAIDILGYEINSKLQTIFYEMYGSYIKNLFRAGNNTKQNPAYVEFPIKNAEGKYIWLRLNMSVTKIQNENLVIITASDVTKKRNSFEEFNEKTLFSTSLVENLRVGILMIDSNHQVVLANQKLISMFHLTITPEEFSSTDYVEAWNVIKNSFVNPDAFEQSTIEMLESRSELLHETWYLKDGRVFERSHFPFKNRYGADFSMCIYEDITKNHLALDIIKESEKKYRGIFENLQFGVVEVDKDGLIIHSSENFCKMTEYTEQHLIGQPIDKFILPDNKKNTVTRLLNTPQGQNSSHEMQLIKSNKDTNWVLVNISPIINQQQSLTGSVLFFYDISERKLLEEALKYVNTYAKKAEESEKFFLASMTHELKTPINAILGMSDLLKMTNIDDEQKEYVEILETSTTYLQKLVSDILDISKIESGNVEIKKVTFTLLPLLLEIGNTFEYSLSQRNIKLKIDFDFKPNLEIIADKVILQQILTNLLSNAEKFTQMGSVMLSVTIEEESTQQIKLKFKVSDTGIGIEEEMKEVIFEKFKQLPSVKLHKSQGSGLGLNIVKQLLALQNSKIEVESIIGEGSAFFFDMVFEKGNSLQQVITAKPNFDSHTQFSSLHVLVVEDNELNQKYVDRVLHKWSVNFDIVSTGEAALIKFHETQYDLILMDLQLPGISGLETATQLRNLYKDHVFTIIAMTAVVTSNIEVEILKSGINDIIRKPFSIADLYDKIQLYFTADNLQVIKKEILFHPKLDSCFLKKFYEKDEDYALIVFESFKQKYLEEFKLIIDNIDKIPLEETKKRLHSIKPAFKMVGLTSIDRDFELMFTEDSNYVDSIRQLLSKWNLAEIEYIIDTQITMLKKEDFA